MKKIGIFGPPRSGTSWLGHIFNSHPQVVLRFQPLFSYGHKGELSSISSAKEINTFFNALLKSDDPFTLMQADSQKNYPVFPKTHRPTHIAFKETRYLNVVRNILESSPDVQIIGILRNPLATLASWMNAPKEFQSSWDINGEWRQAPSKNQGRPEEFFGFDKWKEAANDFVNFEQCFPNRFHLIHYRELNADPESVISNVFRFCDLSMNPQTQEFIRDSRSRHDKDPYSVYRVKVDDTKWRSTLPKHIAEAIINEIKDSPLNILIED